MPDITPMIMHQDALHIPNLGIASVAANIDDEHQVFVGDLVRKRKSVRKFVTKTIKKINPDLVGLSAMAWQYNTCVKIIKLIKSILPNVKIAIGGYHSTLMHDEIAQAEEGKLIDFMISSEGEEAFRRLVNALVGKDKFEDIPSLTYKKDGKFYTNPKGELLDLTKIKLPIRDKRRITDGYHFNMHRMEALETSRGCTRVCNFCSISHMYGQSFRMYPIERIIKDIDDIYYNRKTRWIFITDDNMVLNPERLIELCDAIIAKKYKHLNFFVQADCVSMSRHEEMVKKMGQAGFKSVFLGIENVSKANLELMKKGNIVEATKKAVENCHKYGMAVIGGLIFGLPNDDEQSIIENYSFLKEINADAAYCQIITPYPKTKMRESLIESGLVTNMYDYRWYDGTWANVKTKHLDQDRLQYLFWYHRQNVLGLWKPTGQTKGKYMLWVGLGKIATPFIKFFINRSIKKHGWEGRYQKMIAKKRLINYFKDLDDF